MIKKITAFSVHQTNIGMQVPFTYSEIDESGKVISQNKRAEIVALNPDILQAIDKIYEFLQEKIPE